MSILLGVKNTLPLALSVLSNPRILKVSPPALRFLSAYMNKFRVRSVGDHRILHSHLPPLNSPAYSRFIKEHLILRTPGPSHAQIGLTNACPHNCACCYNRERRGQVMDTDTIIRTARELKQMGVVWLGLTGEKPLLNRDIVEITDSIWRFAVKLFTTGCTLTRRLASDLKHAGLFSVSISLDHWLPEDMMPISGSSREALRPLISLRVWIWMWACLYLPGT